MVPGNNYQKVKNLFAMMNMGVMSHSSYYRLAYHVVIPAVNAKYENVVAANRDTCKTADDGVVVAGKYSFK